MNEISSIWMIHPRGRGHLINFRFYVKIQGHIFTIDLEYSYKSGWELEKPFVPVRSNFYFDDCFLCGKRCGDLSVSGGCSYLNEPKKIKELLSFLKYSPEFKTFIASDANPYRLRMALHGEFVK